MGAQLAPYAMSIVGVLALCLLSVALAVYSGRSKGAVGALSGPVLDARDDNKLYRIDRVHMNSVEALTPFAVSAVIAMLVEVTPALLAGLVWLHLAIRLAHLIVYLRGGAGHDGADCHRRVGRAHLNAPIRCSHNKYYGTKTDAKSLACLVFSNSFALSAMIASI